MTPPRRIFRTRILAAPALLAALALSVPAGAQDVPYGKKPPATKPKAPAKAPAKPQAKRAPAKPAAKAAPKPATKAPAAPAANAPSKSPKPAAAATSEQAPAASAPQDMRSGFEALLAPHGTWEDDAEYGRVWIPHEKTVGSQFAPYRTNGRWAVTDEGDWAWVSDFDWGKVPFHYGRWTWKKDKNWMWVPGEEHAPAWVVWRTGDAGYDFVGWAPMAPEPVAKTDPEEDGEAPRRRVLPFFFAPTAKLFSPNLDRHVVRDRSLGAQIQQHSEIFGGHLDRAVPGELKAASPTFGQVRVPPAAIPKSRLDSEAHAVAPLTLDGLRALLPGAAAPKAEAKAVDAPTDAEPAAVEEVAAPVKETPSTPQASPDEAARFATPPAAEEAERPVRYRCWWTNSRPRIWRCGY